MASRLSLQAMLESVLGENSHVYFQPPPTVQLMYPCIVYSRARYNKTSANNNLYKLDKGYQLTLITREPDPDTLDKLIAIPKCSFDRHYSSDNLHHYSYTIFY